MILIDGRPGTTLPVADRGLHYGDGLFETIAVAAGAPLLLDAHLHRLQRGCRALGIDMPDMALLADECLQVVSGATRAVVKIIVTRGSGGRGYQPPAPAHPLRIVSLHSWPEHPPDNRMQGIDACFCRQTLGRQPTLAGMKHLNRLEQVLARAELAGGECSEGIMCDTDGCVVEGTMSNVFLRRGTTLLTPALDQCGVDGIIRAEVLARAAQVGLHAQVAALGREDVLAAEELFFTNSIIGLWPVRRFDGILLAQPLAGPALARLLVDAGCIAPP